MDNTPVIIPMDKWNKSLIISSDMWRKVLNKWFGIWADGEDELGTQDCAFCERFYGDDDQCIDCPIKENTGIEGCKRTPYTDWETHTRPVKRFPSMASCGCCITFGEAVYCQEALGIALKELEFLIGLCPYEDLVSEFKQKIERVKNAES